MHLSLYCLVDEVLRRADIRSDQKKVALLFFTFFFPPMKDKTPLSELVDQTIYRNIPIKGATLIKAPP